MNDTLKGFVGKYETWNFGRFHRLALTREHPNGGYDVVSALTIEHKDADEPVAIPVAFMGDRELFQSIFDSLYQAGFRATHAVVDETPQRDAHLQDMRRLVETAYKFKFEENSPGCPSIR